MVGKQKGSPTLVACCWKKQLVDAKARNTTTQRYAKLTAFYAHEVQVLCLFSILSLWGSGGAVWMSLLVFGSAAVKQFKSLGGLMYQQGVPRKSTLLQCAISQCYGWSLSTAQNLISAKIFNLQWMSRLLQCQRIHKTCWLFATTHRLGQEPSQVDWWRRALRYKHCQRVDVSNTTKHRWHDGQRGHRVVDSHWAITKLQGQGTTVTMLKAWKSLSRHELKVLRFHQIYSSVWRMHVYS